MKKLLLSLFIILDSISAAEALDFPPNTLFIDVTNKKECEELGCFIYSK